MAEHEVLLYIYDLSQGMAASMSMQLCGKFIPGIWHTAVTIPDFGVEVFFGQGISIVPPGTSHHGQPHQTQSMGTTSIDKETFLEYIEGVKELYTAERYHLLDFNCNNFTQDVVSFLTGRSIPSEISDLPKEFLSTPFGQSLRPMIENMYTGGYRPDASQAVPGLLNNNANSSRVSAGPPAEPSASSLVSPLSMCTNLPSFHNLLNSNDCFVVMFTSHTCPPCRTIKPVFEDLAVQNAPEVLQQGQLPPIGHKTVAFAIVDTSLARDVATECNILATPTFHFYLKGSKSHEIKGADAAELKMQTALLLDAAYPPHPHHSIKVPELQRLTRATVDFDSKPNFEAALARLEKGSAPPAAIEALRFKVVPCLSADGFKDRALPADVLESWAAAQDAIITSVPAAEWFPSLDLLRFAAASPSFWTAPVLKSTVSHLIYELPSKQEDDKTWMLALRLLTNMLTSVWLHERSQLTAFIIEGLLHPQASVRTCAATCAFKAAQLEYGRRPHWLVLQPSHAESQEEWETELFTALLEALQREANSDTAHRLIASIGLLVLYSPSYETLASLCQALGCPGALRAKGQVQQEESQMLPQRAQAQLAKEVMALLSLQD